MDNKKNTILLTVIAVATLLVAVVGATFAYFTAQGAQGTTASVTVSTGTAASSEFGTIDPLNIYADATTFAEGAGDVTDDTTGKVKWTAPGAVTGQEAPSEADRSFCYTADLIIKTNTFTKSAANTTNEKELYFTAVKGSTTLVEEQSLVTLPAGTAVTGTINIPTTKAGKELKHKLIAEAGKTVSDSWTITVTLKNLDIDQNENTGKQLAGSIKFTKVAC